MKVLTPRGTAVQRWLAEQEPRDAAGLASIESAEVEDVDASYLGWELARCAPGLTPDDGEVLAHLAAACVASMLAGSTRLPADRASLEVTLGALGAARAAGAACRLLERATSPSAGDPVAKVIGRPGERKPLIVDDGCLYLERMRLLEQRFCDRVNALLARAIEGLEPRGVRRAAGAVSSGARPLTREQTRAVERALASPLALISGAPGTGKTMTVVALVRAAVWMGTPASAVAIAAPTGKAAQRLAEALSAGLASAAGDIADEALRLSPPVPTTLHRLLGWSPKAGRFAHHEGHRLPHHFVIVDEASMIDLAMMDRLVRALPERGHLVLVGDADQLPSVEAGAVFRDLCAALGASRLTTNLRVASDPAAQSIVTSAAGVNAGVVPPLMSTRSRVEDLSFEGVEHLDARWSEVGDELLERWWRERVALDPRFAGRVTRVYKARGSEIDAADEAELLGLFASYGSARLMAATRSSGFPACADAINQSLVSRLVRVDARASSPQRGPHGVIPGVPVLVQQNDYVRGLFNGDQGLVVTFDLRDSDELCPMLVVMRGGKLEALPIGSHTAIAPAFAMTVHKAQGSEFDHVALVLPDVDHPLLTRELIYTAITRARRSVLVVGPRDVLARAVSRTTMRSSGVAARLEAGSAGRAYAGSRI
jgi:exodeoxyribonuclease V alpha subunit